MKHFTFLKPLLMAIMLVGGVSYAWGDPTSLYERGTTNSWSDADLSEWSASYCTPTISGGLSVATKNGGWTCTKSLSITSNAIVTLNATLKTGGAGGNNGSYDYIQIGGIKVCFNEQAKSAFIDVDGVTTNLTLTYSRNTAYAISVEINTASGAISYEVGSASGSSTSTTAITNVVFGHSKAGREGYDINPVLQKIEILEEEQEVTTADYTINYKDGDDIVKTTSGNIAVGTVIPIESTFWASTTKYIKDGGEASSLTVAAGGSTLNVSVSEAPIYSYTVNATVGGSTVKELASGSIYSGETVTVPYPLYVNVGGTLYQKSANSLQYRQNIVVTSDNQVTEFAYTETDITNVVYFSEGEEVTGAIATAEGGNMSIRSSNAKCGYATSDINLVALPASNYTATMVIYSNSSGGATISFDFDTDYDEVVTGANNGDLRTHDFTLSEGKTIKWKASGDSKNGLDYIYIVDKTAKEIADAIADCKRYETSSAFATAVAAESFSNAAEVYAFHTAWQIAQANASSSNDYTKVIRNAAVADGTDWSGANILSGEKYTGAPDNYYLDRAGATFNVNQTIYGLPAGKYQIKVATRANADTYTHLYVNGGSGDICTTRGNHIGNSGGTLDRGWDWSYVPFEITETTNILIGFYATTDGGWASCDDWHLYKVTEDYPVTVSEAGWATLYTPYALNFAGTGLQAFTATLDNENSTVTLTEVETVPALTGVVLKGAEGNYDIPLAASSSTAQGDLEGSVTWATAYNSVAGKNVYMLVKNDAGKAQFTKVTSGSVAAGKAYLTVANGGSVKAFNVVFAGNEETAISETAEKTEATESLFDLSGRRVNKAQKGIFIANGKKVVIK